MSRNEALSVTDLAKLTEISGATIYNYIAQGLISAPEFEVKGKKYYSLKQLSILKFQINQIIAQKKRQKNQKISLSLKQK